VQERLAGSFGGSDSSASVYSDPEINWKVRFDADGKNGFNVSRERDDNVFHIAEGKENFAQIETPFVVKGIASALELLADTTGKEILVKEKFSVTDPEPKVIWSQPLDSILRPMMHRSDNFLAEQLLQMVSDQQLGYMDSRQLIENMLSADFANLPQAPEWVDGSGMSRYNLFSPRDFVKILEMMKNEFGMDRVREIFPTGGTGTLTSLYRADSGYIYAKTGSLSGVVTLSGFLYTKKKKLLIFSILVNNNKEGSPSIRKSIEGFLTDIRKRY